MKPLLTLALSTTLLLAQEGALDSDRIDNTIILNENAVQNLAIKTEVVEETDFETSIFAVGRIEEIPERKAVLSTRIPGRIVSIDVYVGDLVQEGQVLARIESRQPGNPPPTIKLVAPRAGFVTDSHIKLGQPVDPESELMDISDRDVLWAVAQVPEQEASLIKVGTIARIVVPALGDQVFTSELIRYGISADRETSSLEGIFQIEDPKHQLRPGMRTEFSLITSTRKNVLSVPRESIQGSLSDRFVFIKDFEIENAFLRAPVTLGEQNDRFSEVISGLFPGDEVVTNGSYALSFAGGGNGPSLKEALDAAHGHEHNEDGSEKTGEHNEEAADDHDDHDHGDGSKAASPLVLWWAIAATVLAVVMGQLFWNQKRNA